MWHAEPHSRDAGAHEQIEMIQGASADADQNLVGLDFGLWRVLIDQRFRASVLVDSGEFHGKT
jgi:hypothetical protein